MNLEKDDTIDDYYAVLELAPDASSEDVLDAYDRLRRLFAEDAVATYALFGDGESAEQRKRLDRAFEVLSNDSSRTDYHLRRGIPVPRPVPRSTPSHSSPTSTSMTRPPAAEEPTQTMPATTVTVRHEESKQEQPRHDTRRAEPVRAEPVRAEPVRAEAPRAEPVKAEPSKPEPVKADVPAASKETPASQPVAAASAPAEAPAAPTQTVSQDTPMDDAQYSGGVLSRLRESAGLDLPAIAQKTKISLTHLRAIEGNLYDKLPARVYVRGFVSQYARCLGLSPERVADSYLQIYDRYHQQNAQPAPAKK